MIDYCLCYLWGLRGPRKFHGQDKVGIPPTEFAGVFLSKTIKYLEAIFDTIINISAIFAGVLIILIMLCVCVDVIMRYFFNSPLFWVVELGEYAMLYITFTGAAWLLKTDGHVTIDIFNNHDGIIDQHP